MAIESTKRAVDRDESGRNVRAKRTAKPPAVIIVTNMEPMKLEICWTQRKIRDFRTAKLFQFLHHSERLPSINVSLVEEYIENYDPEDGSSVVQGRIIGIDETILEKVLFLPIGEMAVGTDESSDFSPGRYFKGGMSSFERSQGWRTQEAITPEYVEWLRFVLRRLGLYRHPTYVSKRLLYAAVGAFEGMVFNWAAYVATRIHAEIGAKFKLGKFTSLLCSNYVYAVIAHTLRQPPSEEENPIPVSAPLQRERNLLAQNHNVADVIHEIGESSRTVVQGVAPVIEARRVPSGLAVEEENQVPLLIDINQLAFPEGRFPEGVSLKNAVLKHISQIHCMVRALDVEDRSKRDWEDSKKRISDQNQKIREQELRIQEIEEVKLVLERKLVLQYEAWTKEKEQISRIVEGQRDELIQNRKSWDLEREKFKCQLQAEVDKTELLATEKALLCDQLRCETGKMRSEIEVLQNEVSKLTEELTVRSQSQVSIKDVPEGMSSQQHQLELRDAQILKLEAQIRELGEYNEDLSAQLRKESLEILEEDEDVPLQPESVEPIMDNVVIDQLGVSDK